MRRKRPIIAAIAVLVLVLFGVGFASAWFSAKDDKKTCEKLAMPKGAQSAHVLREGDTRLCVWERANGSTVAVTTLP